MSVAARVSAAVLVTAVAVSACSVPSRPYWWPHSPSNPGAPARVIAVHLGHASTSRYQLGIDIYWDQGTLPAATVRADAARIIKYALSLHANSIALSFPFYTGGPRSSTVYPSRTYSPSPAQIGVFLHLAAEARMHISIRPLLSETTLTHQQFSRLQIRPRSIPAWFRSYRKLLKPYLRVAQAGHAASFVVGTELASLAPAKSQWRGLIAMARRVFHRQLLFEARYAQWKLWDAGQFKAGFAADMWPGFKTMGDGATVAQLTRAWKQFLAAYARQRSLRSLVLSEIGIAAVPGAYQHSGTWFGIGTPTHAGRLMQKRWYTALCAAAKSYPLRGLYWWEINFTANPANPGSYGRSDQFTFIGNPAQSAVRSCFKSWPKR